MSWVRRRIVFPLILAAILAVATAVLFEIVIRAAAPHSPFVRLLTRAESNGERARSLEEFLDRHGVGFHPGRALGGRYRNSLGLQSAEPRPEASPRVVVIGDSYVVNDYPTRWMWPWLLEQRLEFAGTATDSPGVAGPQVLTFAMPGIGPDDYESLWDLAARDVEPDSVVVSFFVGNDFQNFRELRQAPSPRFRAALFLRNFWRFQRNRATRDDGSRVSAEIARGPRDGKLGSEIVGYEEGFDNQRATLAEDYYRALKSEVLNIFSTANQDLLQTEVLRVVEVLARICEKARETDARCLVVIFPDELQVDEPLRASLLDALDRASESFDFDRPSSELAERLAQRGVATLDLLPCLRGSEHPLHRLRDTHLNRRGNLRAAECIVERLESPEGR